MHFGNGPASANTSATSGLLITGQLPDIDLNQWKSYVDFDEAMSGQCPIRQVELTIDHLIYKSYGLSDLNLSLSRKKKAWSLTLQNPVIAGNMVIPDDKQKALKGEFIRLYLPKQSRSTSEIDPEKIPAFHVIVDDFRYGKKEIGKVDLQVAPTPGGVQFNNLTVSSPLFFIQAVGTWKKKQGQPETSLFGQMNSRDLGKVLKQWRVTDALDGGQGVAHFVLEWPGSPQQFKAANLNGTLDFDFRHGRVTQFTDTAKTELGFGRFLNLFSLQSLPKLPINLVGLTKKGFAFDLFRGNIFLTDGNAETQDTALVGPVAWVRVDGHIGFNQKNYDLDLHVIPNVTSSLPLIVGLAGGPIAGAITWVANKILAPHVGKAAEMNYHISGSWDKPNVIKLPEPGQTQSEEHDEKST